MLDNQRIAAFIADRRKSLGLTQAEVAQKLNVSFQAVCPKNILRSPAIS